MRWHLEAHLRPDLLTPPSVSLTHTSACRLPMMTHVVLFFIARCELLWPASLFGRDLILGEMWLALDNIMQLVKWDLYSRVWLYAMISEDLIGSWWLLLYSQVWLYAMVPEDVIGSSWLKLYSQVLYYAFRGHDCPVVIIGSYVDSQEWYYAIIGFCWLQAELKICGWTNGWMIQLNLGILIYAFCVVIISLSQPRGLMTAPCVHSMLI